MQHFRNEGLTFQVVDSDTSDGDTSDGADDGVGDGVGEAAGIEGREAVVLLHGFPQQPSSYDQVAAVLQGHGLRTLVPSQRGYTRAARPRSRRAYGSQHTAADVVALLDAAGLERAHVVGHDWGGAQAWAVAGLHPDRVTSLTVLSTPHPAAMARSWLHSNQALKSWYMAFFQLPVLPELTAGRTLGQTLRNSGLPELYVTEYVDAMATPGARTGALNWYRGMPFSGPAIGPVTVPTSYVWGRSDFALGRTAAELTEQYVTAAYRFVEVDSGHWLPETNPDEVAQVIIDQVSTA